MSILNSPRLLQTPIWPYQINHLSDQARGLVAWWPMALGGGAGIVDLASGRYPLTITGGRWGAAPENALPAYSVAGSTSEYASGAHAPITGYPFTMSCWVTIRALGYAADQYFFSMADWSNANNYIGLHVQDSISDAFRMAILSGGSAGVASSIVPILGAAYNVVGVCVSASAGLLYVNGREAASGGWRPFPTLTGVSLGALRRSTIVAPTDGTIWDARLYNRALSAADVYALYDPATRYDLYWMPWMAGVGVAPAAPVTGARNGDFNISLA